MISISDNEIRQLRIYLEQTYLHRTPKKAECFQIEFRNSTRHDANIQFKYLGEISALMAQSILIETYFMTNFTFDD